VFFLYLDCKPFTYFFAAFRVRWKKSRTCNYEKAYWAGQFAEACGVLGITDGGTLSLTV
jgi:hypothetical protein